jgi:hypothetical protein
LTRTLYIHTGPPKTGTSAVQFLFRDLDDPALTYPKAGQWPDGSHNLLFFAMQGQTQRGSTEIPPLSELAESMAAELRNARQDALISSECFDSPDKLQQLTALAGDAISGFDRIVPVVTLRHPVERAASAYNQAVKDPVQGLQMLPDDYLNETIKSFGLTRLTEIWQKHDTDTIFLSYHPNTDFVQRFASAIGRSDLSPDDTPQRNRSLGGLGLSLLLIGNRRLSSHAEREAFFNQTLRGNKELKMWRGNSFPFSDAAVERVQAQFVREDLETLKTRFGLDLTGWQSPPRIELTQKECNQFRTICQRELPGGRQKVEDVRTILGLFAADRKSVPQ